MNRHEAVACVGVLIRYGADYGIRDGFGETACDMAMRKGYSDIANLLIHVEHLKTARQGSAPVEVPRSAPSSISSGSENRERTATLTTLAALAVGNIRDAESAPDAPEAVGTETRGAHSRTFTEVVFNELMLTTVTLKKALLPSTGGTPAPTAEHSDSGGDTVIDVYEGSDDDGARSMPESGVTTVGPEVAPLFLYFASALAADGVGSAGGTNGASHAQTDRASTADESTWIPMLLDRQMPSASPPKDNQPSGLMSYADTHREFSSFILKDLTGYNGEGSEGTSLLPGTSAFRVVGMICELVGAAYMLWRPLRSLAPPIKDDSAAPLPAASQSPYVLIYSSIFYLSELILFLPSIFFVFVELWSPICRQRMSLSEVVAAGGGPAASRKGEESSKGNDDDGIDVSSGYPSVDVIITCYNEPVDIVEGTLCAALSLQYPPTKLSVYVLDDGGRDEIRHMVDRVRAQSRALRLCERVQCVSRIKSDLVPHHAKAGNINNCLLTEGMRGDFVCIYDSDMVAKPDFLMLTLGHFFREADAVGRGPKALHEEGTPPGCRYRLKSKTAFVQVPQDFYNVPWDDPFGHAARFFYGPMMQGRDGMNATPCVGTGVVFNRRALLSIGGQSYGSVTEDYKTCMVLQHAGFSTVYLNDRLVYGLAPDDLLGTMRQRLRWAMGSLQIMFQDLPLLKPGLSFAQRAVLFQSQFQYVVAIPLVVIVIGPLLYLFAGVTPISLQNGIEFLVLFVLYYWLNRWTIYLAGRSGGVDSLELWRGSQQYMYMVPNNLVAIAKVLANTVVAKREIAFTVTEKRDTIDKTLKKEKKKTEEEEDDASESGQKSGDFKRRLAELATAMPFILYYLLSIGGAVYNIVLFANGELNLTESGAVLVAFVWALLLMLYMWPPIGALLPSIYCCFFNGEESLVNAEVTNIGSVAWSTVVREDEGLGAASVRGPMGHVPSRKSIKLSRRARKEILRKQTLRSVVNAGFDVVSRYPGIGRRRGPIEGLGDGDYPVSPEKLSGDGLKKQDATAVVISGSSTPLSARGRSRAFLRSRSAQVVPLDTSRRQGNNSRGNLDSSSSSGHGQRKSALVDGGQYMVTDNVLFKEDDLENADPLNKRRTRVCRTLSGRGEGYLNHHLRDDDYTTCDGGHRQGKFGGSGRTASVSAFSNTDLSDTNTCTTIALDRTTGIFGELITSGRALKCSASFPSNTDVSMASIDGSEEDSVPRIDNRRSRRGWSRKRKEMPVPSIILPKPPRFSVSMYLFFIVNGLLFAFFVVGGIIFIVLEAND